MHNLETKFLPLIASKMKLITQNDNDPSHDSMHLKRVVKTARELMEAESADPWIVLPAAWMHDMINLPKNHPDRAQASRQSGKAAIDFLKTIQYPEKYFAAIEHAIAAHSFSANIKPESIESMIVQDADRLDSLGAIGIARCFLVAEKLNRSIYCEIDPFCEERNPNDQEFTIDHFYVKLLKLTESLNTKSGRAEGKKRVQFMNSFLENLNREIENTLP
ncbi:MAG: HD domain-containing protein [Bacteriovoracaceae bacterium]|nr:HD domain-containing protein [Bacteriovoracaceae bacterium]